MELELATTAAVLRALDECPGDVLVFLPGVAEIRRTDKLLRSRLPKAVLLWPLYGALPPRLQDAAMFADPEGEHGITHPASRVCGKHGMLLRMPAGRGQWRKCRTYCSPEHIFRSTNYILHCILSQEL